MQSTSWRVAPLAVACAAMAACASDTSDPPPSSHANAEKSFWTAMHAGDFGASASVAADLQKQYDANPNEPRNAFLLGAVHFWRTAEAARDPANAQAVRAKSAPLATKYLQEAHDRDPSNAFVTGFLGMNLGGTASDASTLARAKALVDEAYQEDAYFIGFIQMLLSHGLTRDDPGLRASIDTAVHSFELCAGTTLDRAHPDMQPHFATLKASGNPFCWDNAIAPHVVEGAWFHIADNYLKLGKIDVAKVWYANVRALETFPSWPHKGVLDRRNDADLPALAAAYASGDPLAWPSQGDAPYTCTLCHGNTGK